MHKISIKYRPKLSNCNVIKVVRSLLYGISQSRLTPYAATSGINSLILASSVPLLVVLNHSSCFAQLAILALRILSASSKQEKYKLLKFFAICIYKYEQLRPGCAKQKHHNNKACHAALTTIKQGNQHTGPNRNTKHNQSETAIHYSICHVHVLTKNSENTRGQCIYSYI